MKEYPFGYGATQRVSCCLECPACYNMFGWGKLCCLYVMKDLPDIADTSSGTPPDWCPLPEAKEVAK